MDPSEGISPTIDIRGSDSAVSHNRFFEDTSFINYICPNCGGGFNHWDTDDNSSLGDDYVCPFCGIKRGEYEPGD